MGDQSIMRVNYEWAEQWVAKMKRVDHLAPGTIRHYVGALARCFDYLVTCDRRREMRLNLAV
jgi:predicted YcjX-like family ATPase